MEHKPTELTMPNQKHKPAGSPNGSGGQFDRATRQSRPVLLGPVYDYQEIVDVLAYCDSDDPIEGVAYHFTSPHHESDDYYCPRCAVQHANDALGEDAVEIYPDEAERINATLTPETDRDAVECSDCGLVLTSSLGYTDNPSWRLIAMSAEGELQNLSAWEDALQYYADKFTPEFKKHMSERSTEFRKIEDGYS
jgi:hypothetical protein